MISNDLIYWDRFSMSEFAIRLAKLIECFRSAFFCFFIKIIWAIVRRLKNTYCINKRLSNYVISIN
jgi:hypothetical protein